MGRQQRVRILILAVVVVAVLAVLAYVVANRGTEMAVPVRITYMRVNTMLSYLVAADKGFFGKRGLQVELIPVESANQGIESLVAGRSDIGIGISVQTTYAAWATSPGLFHAYGLFIATASEPADCILVKKDSPITNFSDLAGKKVGGIPSTYIPFILDLICEKNGLSSKCVQYVTIASNLHLEALQAGTVDAAYTFAVQCDSGVKTGLARVLMQNPQLQILSPMPSLFALVSASFEKDHPRAFRAVQDAVQEGIEFIRKNPEEARAIRNKYIPGSPDASLGSAFNYQTSKEMSEKDLQTFADLLLQRGLLTKKVDIKEIVRK